MIEKPILDSEEWVISLNDVKRLYISIWKRLVMWGSIGGLLGFIYFSSAPSTYLAEASFKEGVERSSSESFFKELMVGVVSANQPQASSIMKSYQVLKPLIEKLGLQISLVDSRWKVTRLLHRFSDNFTAERGIPLADLDPFAFQNVHYEKEKGLSFHLKFSDSTHFIIYGKDRREEIGQGCVGSSVELSDVSAKFTLTKIPEKLKTGVFYPFSIQHWIPVADGLKAAIKIKKNKDNPALINVLFAHRDRYLASKIVNELMSEYQSHLKREYDHVAKEQLGYLENKQEQILGKMGHLFDQHVAYLRENLENTGFIGLEQESKALLIPHQQMQQKMHAIEVELERLDEIEKEGKVLAIAEEGGFSHGFNQILQKIQELKQQRDLLELSLCQVNEHTLTMRRDELKEIRNQRFLVEQLVKEVDQGQVVSYFDLDEGLCDWAKSIRDPEEREDFAEYLENYARILSMREKTVQERYFYGNSSPTELDGIDYPSAQTLFLEYNAKLDSTEGAMRHYAQFKTELARPDFDIASLSSVLKDSLCQKLIADASSLGLLIKDDKHHSAKEERRWEEEIALHRKILSNHLDQLYKVEEVNASLIRDKMVALQKVSLDCIHRQISVLHEQANDMIKHRRKALLLEQSLTEQKMESIRSALAAALPEKWRFEKWLEVETDLVSRIMKSVTEVAESKTLSAHMHRVESKPLDQAVIPMSPQPPKLLRMSAVAAFATAFLLFSIAFIQQILKGFPSSFEKLKSLHFPLMGSISSFCDGPCVDTPTGSDLDLLRQIALFARGGKVISLIGGRGPDYSYALGENLSRMSAKSIVLRCDFQANFQKEDTPGLVQIWKGETADFPIRKGKGFDYLTAGGYTPFGVEIVQSQSFAQLIALLKSKYDWVFLLFRGSLSSAESIAALRLCEKAIVTVSGEQIQELTPFVNWAYHENECRLKFITRS